MVSFKMRRVFYSTAAGAQEILLRRKLELQKIGEIEKQIILAKKIMDSISDKRMSNPAGLIRAEGKLHKLELKLQEQKYRASIL